MLELESTRQKVNGYVFEQCCGLKDELGLYRLLHRMAQGELSKEEFRETAKQEKVLCVKMSVIYARFAWYGLVVACAVKIRFNQTVEHIKAISRPIQRN